MLDLTGEPARLLVKGLVPVPGVAIGGVEIDIVAGYGATPDQVPPLLAAGVRLLTAHWYASRGEPVSAALPPDVADLVAPYRKRRLAHERQRGARAHRAPGRAGSRPEGGRHSRRPRRRPHPRRIAEGGRHPLDRLRRRPPPNDWSSGDGAGARVTLALEAEGSDAERDRTLAILDAAATVAEAVSPTLPAGRLTLVRVATVTIDRAKDGRRWRGRLVLEP